LILTDKLLIKITNRNFRFYKNCIGNIKISEILEVPIEKVNINSTLKVKCKCDLCDKISEIGYRKYILNIKKNKIYIGYECRIHLYRKTCIDKYGVDNVSKIESIKEVKEQTCLKKYGTKNPHQNKEVIKKAEETNIKRYGFKNVFQNEDIKSKIKDGYKNKFDVDYPSQVPEIHKKIIINSLKLKKFNNTSICFQGSYEEDFLKIYYDILPNIKRGLTFKYLYNNKKCIYYSDFYIKELNLIIEIKNNYLYKRDFKKIKTKEKSVKKFGYNFILIIDKNYKKLNSFLKQKHKNNSIHVLEE
jgi:hypothetical protein